MGPLRRRFGHAAETLRSRSWFRLALALGNALMAVGFIWALVEGWDAIPGAVALPVLVGAVAVLLGTSIEIIAGDRAER
jgi:hypothetical protein